jgi:hypothetical protein
MGQATPPDGNDFTAIAAGVAHSLALRADGSIVGWGEDRYGLAAPPPGNDFIAIAAGLYHDLALRSDGSIVGWGDNKYAQATPPDGNDFVAIAAGGGSGDTDSSHSLALRCDGSILSWGDNRYGQASPPDGNDFVAIATGGVQSFALRATPPEIWVVERRRVGRTVFEYECTGSFENLWGFAVKNLELGMVQGSGNMTIIEPVVEFGDAELQTRGRVMSTDTCTFRVDRSRPIDPDEIVWKVRCEKVITGQQMELTVAGVDSSRSASISSEFLVQQQSDFADLSALSGRWLWTDPAGTIEEDTIPDGRVNLADFAEFAQHWKTNP